MNRKIIYMLSAVLLLLTVSCFDNEGVIAPKVNNDSGVPNSPKPANGTVNTDDFVRLEWKCSGASSYTVYLDKVNPPVKIIKSNIKEKHADVVVSGAGEIYYWKVVAKFSNGKIKSSPVWHFSTSNSANGMPGYILTKHSLTTAPPNHVLMLFQVTDRVNKGVDNLLLGDFEIFEDGETVSKYESQMNITKRQANPYVIKTVLMLDNSTSISDDANSLQLLKNAAKNFVDNIVTQQVVALYKFSNKPEKILDFTSNKTALKAAIDNISRGFATTNLYGAVIEGAQQWRDIVNISNIVQGSMVLFTDGNDTQGSRTLNEALAAIEHKKVYTVGQGSEIEPEILHLLGNQGAYAIDNMSELNQVFIQIQEEIVAYANSFYWMEYASPKRGNYNHKVELLIKNNPIYSSAEGTFSSAGFYDPAPGIYVNSSFVNPSGDSVYTLIAGGNPVELRAVTYGGDKSPVYNWGTNSSLTVDVLNPPENSEVKIYAKSSASAGKVTIILDDTENGFSKALTFNITK